MKEKLPVEGTASQAAVLSRIAGEVSFEEDKLNIKYVDTDEKEYFVPQGIHLIVKPGNVIEAGQQITEGVLAPQDILQVVGKEAVERYLVDEVQKVYRSQGVSIHDKHISVIVRQMLRKVTITSSGDTQLLPGELVERLNYEDINARVMAEGGEPASAQPVLLGISRASLNKESWLASASFQETGRVLVDAATKGKTTQLLGLKENVILGKLIPSRVLTDEDLAELRPQLQPLVSEEVGEVSPQLIEEAISAPAEEG